MRSAIGLFLRLARAKVPLSEIEAVPPLSVQSGWPAGGDGVLRWEGEALGWVDRRLDRRTNET